MGRYSSVQAYADSNSNMRSVSYEQATGSSEVKQGTVKAEKVSNPYGSTAGAGSGEFHVYRHARSREMERWKQMDEQEKQERLDRDFEDNLKKANEETSAKTDKNRRKRQRQKEAKQRKKNLQLSGVAAAIVGEQDKQKKQSDEEEFSYTPTAAARKDEEGKEEKTEDDAKLPAFPSDGTFLEKMKAQLAAAEGKQKPAAKAKTEEEADSNEPPAKRQAT